MNDLVTYQSGLPDTIENLAKFLLIAPEKAKALKAEIKAIGNLNLAQEVYQQKKEEQEFLCGLILDASVKLGEFTKAIPKAPPDRKSQQYQRDSADGLISTKAVQIAALGFTPKQVERFETLASNQDLVDHEKAAAREENRMPTRTNVLDLAKVRKDRYERDMAQIDEDGRVSKAFATAIYTVLKLPDATDVSGALLRNSKGDVSGDINNLTDAIDKLAVLKSLLQKGEHTNGNF